MIGQNNIVHLSTDLECEVAEGQDFKVTGRDYLDTIRN